MEKSSTSPKKATSTFSIWTNPIYFLAFGFGSGLSPVAPGTCGTLAAIPLYLLIKDLPLIIYLAIVIGAIIFGTYLCEETSKALEVHDHPGIVWDEIAGYLLTMTAAPHGWMWVALGFGLFRFFDILKPFPIGYFDEKVQTGFGIMLDDLLAAVYAWLILQGINFLITTLL